MGSINSVVVLGRLGADPEARASKDGGAIANFTMATDDSYTDKSGTKVEKAEWHRLVAFGKTAELVNRYLKKGSEVCIQGKLRTDSYEKDGIKRYTTNIVVERLTFIGKPPTGATSSSSGLEDAPF